GGDETLGRRLRKPAKTEEQDRRDDYRNRPDKRATNQARHIPREGEGGRGPVKIVNQAENRRLEGIDALAQIGSHRVKLAVAQISKVGRTDNQHRQDGGERAHHSHSDPSLSYCQYQGEGNNYARGILY